ncbi:hypothetical protein F4778DRAFT_720970 [Xylariomycetidae sp. FL2044]|nr:hypothetical protein F4778DRAFT_720970 [Xylariomycetidae sp. FL2044]
MHNLPTPCIFKQGGRSSTVVLFKSKDSAKCRAWSQAFTRRGAVVALPFHKVPSRHFARTIVNDSFPSTTSLLYQAVLKRYNCNQTNKTLYTYRRPCLLAFFWKQKKRSTMHFHQAVPAEFRGLISGEEVKQTSPSRFSILTIFLAMLSLATIQKIAVSWGVAPVQATYMSLGLVSIGVLVKLSLGNPTTTYVILS